MGHFRNTPFPLSTVILLWRQTNKLEIRTFIERIQITLSEPLAEPSTLNCGTCIPVLLLDKKKIRALNSFNGTWNDEFRNFNIPRNLQHYKTSFTTLGKYHKYFYIQISFSTCPSGKIWTLDSRITSCVLSMCWQLFQALQYELDDYPCAEDKPLEFEKASILVTSTLFTNYNFNVSLDLQNTKC